MVENPGVIDSCAIACTVCIANYNGASIIVDCINSVLGQEGGPSTEIIIHDDASSDGSVEIIRQSFPADVYSQIRILESPANVGFCISNNRMVAEARGDFILLLNNDAVLDANAIASLYQAAREQSRKGILSLPQFDWGSGEIVDRGCLLDPFFNPVPNLDATRSDVAMSIGACLWIPRHLWAQIGGFPAWFGSIAEDMLICTQARLLNYPVQIVHESAYRHKQGASFGGNRAFPNGLSTTYRRRMLSERNKTFVMVICLPAWLLCSLLPLHVLVLLLEGATLSTLKRDLRLWREVYWNAVKSLLTYRKELAQQRNKIQSLREVSIRAFLSAFSAYPRKLTLLKKYGVPSVS
ncbi:glycosyltransferase family 2 protein [Shewanella chilikensis]|uniref:glycosyltransferase family 2 protein n=1 Tax=Shewanella chilikensis TaxID=558541 RepID=UPI003A98537C